MGSLLDALWCGGGGGGRGGVKGRYDEAEILHPTHFMSTDTDEGLVCLLCFALLSLLACFCWGRMVSSGDYLFFTAFSLILKGAAGLSCEHVCKRERKRARWIMNVVHTVPWMRDCKYE